MEEFFNSDTFIIIGVAIIAPAIGGLLVSLFRKKNKTVKNPDVVALCENCGAENGLHKVRNYICHECGRGNSFFNSLDGTNPKKELMFKCKECDEQNFKGLQFCPHCKHENPLPKKKQK